MKIQSLNELQTRSKQKTDAAWRLRSNEINKAMKRNILRGGYWEGRKGWKLWLKDGLKC